MEAVAYCPSYQTSFLLSSLLLAPLLLTYSSIVSIYTLHKTHTFLVCLDWDSSSRLRRRILVTPWLYAPPLGSADVGVHTFFRCLTADVGFLASCRSRLSWVRVVLCFLWKELHVAASKGWVPCKCPWEWAGVGEEADTVADWFKLQTCTPHNIPGNLIEEVNLPLTFRVMNFFSRADRNRAKKEEENIFSPILETNIISRNTSKYTIVFQVLSSAIKEEKFLSWLQSEPPILLWLPTCYRLSATEMVTHPVRCRICRNFPIMGLRYSHSPLWHGQSFFKWL